MDGPVGYLVLLRAPPACQILVGVPEHEREGLGLLREARGGGRRSVAQRLPRLLRRVDADIGRLPDLDALEVTRRAGQREGQRAHVAGADARAVERRP